MATKHPTFKAPPSPNMPIWRYMDFTKYVAMLESSVLFFCRADKLGDPLEGSVSAQTIENRKIKFRAAPAIQKGGHTEEAHLGIYHSIFSRLPKLTYVSCWHMNQGESVAMWKLYAPSGMGVALRSTYESLFNLTPAEVFVGLVQYEDYDHATIPDNDPFAPFVFKRKSFAHENEVRAVIQLDATTAGDLNDFQIGMRIALSPQELVTDIRVSPGAPKWYTDLVRDITKRYGLNKTVTQSQIDSIALY